MEIVSAHAGFQANAALAHALESSTLSLSLSLTILLSLYYTLTHNRSTRACPSSLYGFFSCNDCACDGHANIHTFRSIWLFVYMKHGGQQAREPRACWNCEHSLRRKRNVRGKISKCIESFCCCWLWTEIVSTDWSTRSNNYQHHFYWWIW